MLRFIDKLNNMENVDEEARIIRREIRRLKNEPTSRANKKAINKLYDLLDSLLFKPDYMYLVIDREKDYWRACEGFTVNGIKYARLLGTNGGVKTKTIVFVSERLVGELRRLIDNGRDKSKELVPAKFEAYRALTCSGSTPVSWPKGIAVVDDCVTHFKSDVIELNDEADGEPVMKFVKDADIELDESDGYGLILPSLAERWSEELQLGYMFAGCNTRCSWEKGCVFTFDFLDFADNVAGTRIIKDAWGNEVDLSEVEMILTTSMLKLWDSYESCQHYLDCCHENGYTFGIAKVSPKKLEKQRSSNYQFLNSYYLTDEDIHELIRPTVEMIKDVIVLDPRKSILYLKGFGLNDQNVDEGILNSTGNQFAEGLMIDKRLINDKFVRRKIYEMISRRIDDAKIGVLAMKGNYAIICGDPYSLCQSMFGMEVTGLLKAGEIYHKFWIDEGASEVACFRAPMTCHNNIVRMKIANSEEMAHWYQYMDTVVMLNSWDTAAAALNGCDKDGDLLFTTDNRVLVDNLRDLPALMCFQRKAKKMVPNEKNLIQANIDSFGNDIGKVTNRATSMYDLLSKFEKGSKEYEVLEYRIMCSQQLQQNAIDKTKGIVAKPMPQSWYNKRVVENDITIAPDDVDLYLKILADRKPYFMTYIYPDLRKEYRKFVRNVESNCLRMFRKELNELLEADPSELSEKEQHFVDEYYRLVPVVNYDCVTNRICRAIEKEFDNFLKDYTPEEEFDITTFKSDVKYSSTQFYKIRDLYQKWKRDAAAYREKESRIRIKREDARVQKELLVENFIEQCYREVSNRWQLCNIIVDLCYRTEGTKQFAWDVVGREMLSNLLAHNNYTVSFPTLDENGEIEWNGERFTMVTKHIEMEDIDEQFDFE